jgi:hypothetical protein
MINVTSLSVEQLEKIKILVEDGIYYKKIEIGEYLTYRLKKYLLSYDTSNSYTYIISNLVYNKVIKSLLVCKFENNEMAIYTQDDTEHFTYQYMEKFWRLTYDFLSREISHSPEGSLNLVEYKNYYLFHVGYKISVFQN